MFKEFFNKINKKKAKILIIGLGYVGYPLLSLIKSKKFKVSGLDLNKERINYLRKKNKKVTFYDNYPDINFRDVNIIIIALPTPIDSKKKPDLESLRNCIDTISKIIDTPTLIVLESTTYPSTTKEFIVKPFSKNFKIGDNFFIGYSPEREDPGNKNFGIKNIPKITSGYTNNCQKLTTLFYSKICKSVKVASSIETAEMTKIFENIFRAINIGLVNETKQISKKLNVDMDEIINLAKTKPFGFMPFYPGPGVGGHCIPVDPYYLSWLSKKKRIATKFIHLAGDINSNMPLKISKEIKNYFIKYKVKNPKILLIGVSYKKNIDDCRNSPAVTIFKNLLKNNKNIFYHDKFVSKLKINKTIFFSKNLNKNLLSKMDAIILTTDHSYLNKKFIYSNSKLIFDTRNFFEEYKKNIIKL